MKTNIHPELHEITAYCACGSMINTRSTNTDIKLTICSACHPFFTGEQKLVDTAGRIDRFNSKYAAKKKK